MKYLLFVFLLFLSMCQSSDEKVIQLMKEKFPLTYEKIEKNAREKYGESRDLSSQILEQCKAFTVVQYLLENPEKCGTDKESFFIFFSLAIIQNSLDENFSPVESFKCIKEAKTTDEKCACLNVNWIGVFNTLMEEIKTFNELKDFYPKGKPFDPEKTKSTLFI